MGLVVLLLVAIVAISFIGIGRGTRRRKDQRGKDRRDDD